MLKRSTLEQFPWITLGLGLIAIGMGVVLGFGVSLLDRPAYIVAGLAGAIAALVCILNPRFGLYILVSITFLRLSDVLIEYHGAPSIAKPFIALMVGVVLLNWWFREAPPRATLKAFLLVLAYGLVISLSVFYASDFYAVANALDDFWKNGIIAILVVMLLRDGRSLRNVIWVLIASGIFLGTISVWQYLTSSFDNNYWGFGIADYQNIAGSSSGYRISGPIGDPNFFAQIMLIIVPLAFSRFLSEKSPILKMLALWGFVASLMTVVFTFSRGAFVALLLMSVLMFYFHPPKLRELLLSLFVIVLAIPYIPAGYMERVLTLDDLVGGSATTQTDVSFRGRSSEYTAAWMMFADHPLVGVGIENYESYYQRYSRQIGLDSRSEARSAHSLYLETAAELGLAGLAVLAVTLFVVFRSIVRSWRVLHRAGEHNYSDMVVSIGIGFAGYLFAAAFVHDAYPRYFWLMVGLGLAAAEAAKHITVGNGFERAQLDDKTRLLAEQE
jgi:putative inorganic carbon (hco3(-)) transporter